MARKRKPEVIIDIESTKIDFTINDSCLVCEVKTSDGSVMCDKCLKEALKIRGIIQKKLKNRGVA